MLKHMFNDIGIKVTICLNQLIKTTTMEEVQNILKEFDPINGRTGYSRMYNKIKLRFNSKNMHNDIKNYVKNCSSCQVN